jgi:hypothetical protein
MTTHLDDATLALLADRDPSAQEQAHLRTCVPCRQRLREYVQQLELLRALPDREAPDAIWEGLRSRLEHDPVVLPLPVRRTRSAAWMQAAAAALLFATGVGTGVVVRSTPAQRVEQVVQARVRVDSVATSDWFEAQRTLTERAAALEALVGTAEAALQYAPSDPIIQSHYQLVRRDRDLLRERVPIVSNEAQWF